MPSLKKNFFYSALLTLANYIFPLITYPYVSRVLGVTNIGICNFVDGVVNYFIMFSMMGITTIGVREIAAVRDDRTRRNQVFSSLASLNAVTSLLAAAALVAAIFCVPKLYEHKELMGIGVVRLLANFLCMEWLFKGLEDFRYITLRSVAVRTLYVAAVFIFVREPDDYGVYYLLLCLTIVANALVNLLYSRRFVSFTRKGLSTRSVLGPFFLIGLYTVMASMYTSFNSVYLGFVSTAEQVGYYGSAAKIFGMVIALFTAFTAVMLPRLSAVLAEGREEEFRKIVLTVIRVLFCLGVPLVLLLEAEAADLIRLISGKGYEGAVTPMRIVAPLILVIGLEQVLVLQTMLPKKHDREVLVNSIVGAVVGVLLNILLVRKMEAVGSAVVWLLSECAVLAGALAVVTRKIRIPFPVRDLLVEVVRNLPLAVLLFLLLRIRVPFHVRFFLASGLTAAYFLLLHLVVFPNPEIKSLIRSVIPARWWGALREFRAHLYLLRLLPFRDAVRLIRNRTRYGFAEETERRSRLNEEKHRLIGDFLEGIVLSDSQAAPADSGAPGTFPVPPVWVCWLQGDEKMPELNRICVESIRENAGNHPVVFLSLPDIPGYLSVPPCIERAFSSGRIKPAIYTDYVRCALLSRYGGVWLDSTMLLTGPLGNEWFRAPFMSVRQEEGDNASVSRYRWATFCLGAVQGSPFFRKVESMFRAYFERKGRNVDYLMIDYFFDLLYRKDAGMREMMDRVPVSNPALHELRSLLNEPYDPVRMAAMEETTGLFKLTYKTELRENCESGLTFWGYLRQKYRP